MSSDDLTEQSSRQETTAPERREKNSKKIALICKKKKKKWFTENCKWRVPPLLTSMALVGVCGVERGVDVGLYK